MSVNTNVNMEIFINQLGIGLLEFFLFRCKNGKFLYGFSYISVYFSPFFQLDRTYTGLQTLGSETVIGRIVV